MPSKSFKARRDQLVRGAVARIWPLFQKAPSPFTGYKAAEKYLAQRLASQHFDYAIDANATTEHVWNVKNRVHHEFTREAEKAGLFIIDRHPQEVMADAMADATPHHIQVVSMNNTQLLETMISEWPNSFTDLREARHWAREIYRQNGLESNLCAGKAPSDARNQAVNLRRRGSSSDQRAALWTLIVVALSSKVGQTAGTVAVNGRVVTARLQ